MDELAPTKLNRPIVSVVPALSKRNASLESELVHMFGKMG